MVLAYALGQRLDKTGWFWLNIDRSGIDQCVTRKVVAAIRLSRPWIINLGARAIDSGYELQPATLDLQMEGLEKFAEHLQWPCLHEVRNLAEIIRHAEPQSLHVAVGNSHLWDRLYALTLPGRYFAQRLCSLWSLASRSTKNFGLAPSPESGLVMGETDLTETIVCLRESDGRLERCQGHCRLDWTMSCPKDQALESVGENQSPGRLIPEIWNTCAESRNYAPDQGLLDPQPGEDAMKYIEDLKTWSKQIVPQLSRSRSDPSPNLYAGGGTRGAAKQPPRILRRRQVETIGASIEFEVGIERVIYTLKTKPTFVAAPPCLEGLRILRHPASRQTP